jgi:hypothetical protein
MEYSEGQFACSTASAALVLTWGDGSGRGTDGSFTVADHPLKMWNRKWSPCVYQFCSNWKEFETLRLTLERLLEEEDSDIVRGTTIFYFYQQLDSLLDRSIQFVRVPLALCAHQGDRILEMGLACSHLQVIQVSGLVMINQGTYCLSGGIWMTTRQGLASPRQLRQALLDPLTLDSSHTKSVGPVSPGSQQLTGHTAISRGSETPTTSSVASPSASCHQKLLSRLSPFF